MIIENYFQLLFTNFDKNNYVHKKRSINENNILSLSKN